MSTDDAASPEIVVVGSINLDISIPVAHLPAPGETVLGGDGLWSPGGKGANQAVAAARLGRRVAMVGAVGGDSAGTDLLTGLRQDRVDISGVAVLDGIPTGVATIAVDAAGENSIVVSSGANARVNADQILELIEAGHALGSAPVVMAQFEVPVVALLAAAQRISGRLLLNPAPAISPDSATGSDDAACLADLMAACDVLIPNRGELATLVGAAEAATTDELVDQAKLAVGTGPDAGSVVVTLGGDGALVVHDSNVTQIPIIQVETLDTTAAGDSFCGALADALVDGASVVEAARWAARCAAVTVTRRGAQNSLPTRADVGRPMS